MRGRRDEGKDVWSPRACGVKNINHGWLKSLQRGGFSRVTNHKLKPV